MSGKNKIILIISLVIITIYFFLKNDINHLQQARSFEKSFEDLTPTTKRQPFQNNIISNNNLIKKRTINKKKNLIKPKKLVKKKRKKKKAQNKTKQNNHLNNSEHLNPDNSLLNKTVSFYQKMSLYPDNSKPLDGKNPTDPLLNKKNNISDTITNNKFANGIYVKKHKKKNLFFVSEDEPTIYLETFQNDQPVSTIIEGTVWDTNENKIGNLNFTSNNTVGYYKGIFNKNFKNKNQTIGNHLVKIKVHDQTNNKNSIYLFDSFIIDYRKNKFKDKVKSSMTKGKNLLIQAKYRIYEPGDYVIEATLYDVHQKPIAWAENTVSFSTGTHWVPIEFHGYIFYNNKLSGPFLLKNMSLSYVKKNLATSYSELDHPNFSTAKYHWSKFNTNPYDNIIMNNKLKQLSSAN